MSASPVENRPIITSRETPSSNLWKIALDTLPLELRNSLDLSKANHTYILSQALKEAQEERQVCVQKCLTLKKRNGETIILRDVIEKIIGWVEKFIAVGDTAVQYDPAHAAPAWTAFRFVLQVVVNDKKTFGETIENLEAVSHLITRYAILEELYLQRISRARDKLEEMVVRLYAEILTFLAKVRKYFQSSAKRRLGNSILRFSEDEQMTKIKLHDGQISSFTEVFTLDMHIDTAKGVASMHALLKSLNEPIKRMADYTSISARVLHESQRLQFLHWLSPVPFSSHHKRHSESRMPSSGQWLLDHDRYLHWRNTSSSSIFLLHGIIGSGKTSLASVVVDSFLRERSGQASPAPLAYFYCTRNSAEAERSNPDEIMRSILRQLTVSHGSSSTIHERVLQEYESRQAVAKADGFEITRLQAADCVRLILDTTAANPATLVIDAVDEVQRSSRHVLLSALTHIVQKSLSVVKVFVTSRSDTNIHVQLPGAVAMRIENEHTRRDMDDFVYQQVSSLIQNRRILNGIISESLRQEMMRVLIAGAGEMFLWVVRQVENLCRMKTEADIRTAMRALPTHTLEELYEEDFTRMSNSGQHARSYAVQVFSILLCAQEALSPEALMQAMAKPDSLLGETMTLARMTDICFNLVVLDSELNVLRFAHISFQEFLEARAEFAPQYVHRIAATTCLDSCLEGLPRGMETDLSPKNDFHHYSAVYWAEHCRISILDEADYLITSKMKELVFDEGDVALGFIDWVEEVPKFINKLPIDHALAKALRSVIHSDGSPLFTACIFGLTPIIDDLAYRADYNWDQTNDSGQSGVYLAAVAGHGTIVKNLLQHQVLINTLGGKFCYPLHAACFSGHASIVQLLLDYGADPKLGPRSALEYALLADHEDIALLLLDGRFDVTNEAEYDSILQQAAETGSADVVQFLQKKYASLYGHVGSSRCRAVEVAIFKGRMGVVERYLQKLSDPKVDMPKDAIATAALGGQDAIIEFLVDQGLDLDQEGVLGTPLRSASIMCHESTVRLLMRLGASLNVSGSFGEPLQAAAMGGHETITRLLLNHGADVCSKGGLYGTALQAATHRGHQKIVQILLDAGANVHQKGFSRDAFHAASEGGHEGIVRLLLERGFKIRHPLHGPQHDRCFPNKNLLRDASPSRHQETEATADHQRRSQDWRERASVINFPLVEKMMRGPVTSEHESMKPYQSPDRLSRETYGLCAAAAKGHVSVVELLLNHLNTMDSLKPEIVTAFQEACGNGHEQVVALFLSQFSQIDIPNLGIVAAFGKACENGHENVVNRLLSDRALLKDPKAAFEVAALKGHLTVVNVLIDHEERLGLARVETVKSPTKDTYEYDSTARAVMISGSKGGHRPIVRRGQDLVAQRCTDTASRYLYGKALATAAANRNADVMEALLESDFEHDLEGLTNTLNSVCAWGNEELLRLLLKSDTKSVLGIQQYSGGLRQSVRNNNHSLVMYWLEEHPEHHNLVVDPVTVIDVSRKGFVDILPLLMKYIRPMDRFERILSQCLQAASEMGHKEVVGYLIKEGANVNAVVEEAQRTNGDTSLCDYDSYDHVDSRPQKLSALQAALFGFERFDPYTKARYLQYPQHSWIEADLSSRERTVEILLGKGADPNRADKDGRYPLNIAAAYCTVEVVQKLISSGADAEAATTKHGTALQAAARREVDSLSITKALLGAKASLSAFDPGKAAALDDALSFFGTSRSRFEDGGKFQKSTSIADLLSSGAGAVVKVLLSNLPEEKASDSRYCLLAQMACVAGDEECINYYCSVAASRVGNIQICERLLKYGADVNIVQGVYHTALRAAVVGGHENVVCTLIARGADVNLRDKDDSHETVLHLALRSGNNTSFKLLLDAGADVNTELSHQKHILIAACNDGDTESVEFLLASGADVNVLGTGLEYQSFKPPFEKARPLHVACAKGYLPVVQLLLEHGADIEKTNEYSDREKKNQRSYLENGSHVTPLIAAIRWNRLLAVRLLLDAGADVNHAVNITPLSEAAKKCKLEVVEELLGAGAIIGDPSTKGNALAEACKSRQYIVVELLLATLSGNQYEAEICGEALFGAISCGDDKMVRLLVEHGVPPSFEMLRRSCSAGMLEAVRVMVDQGMDINEDDGDDAPLLHVAASHLKLDIMQFLISQGANVMLRSRKYGGPLIAALEGAVAPLLRSSRREPCAALAKQLPLPNHDYWRFESQGGMGYKQYSQCEQIVRTLLGAGAEVEMTTRKFGNALHLASYMGSEVIVRLLFERMEDINILGGYFESPLIAGLEGDHPIIVSLLLDRGIDVNRSLPEHGSALHYACAHGSKTVIQSLLDHGADTNAYDDKHGSVLAAAASRTFPFESSELYDEKCAILELLLRHEPKVQIREGDLLAAVSCKYRHNLMRLFFQYDTSVVATEAVIVKTIIYTNNAFYRAGCETLRLVLKHDGGLGTTLAMAEAADTLMTAQKAEATKILLEHKPIDRKAADSLDSMSKRVERRMQEWSWEYRFQETLESHYKQDSGLVGRI